MKKVLYILFHRSVLVALSLLAQVVTLVVMVNIFSEYINSFYWCCIAISVIAALLQQRHQLPGLPGLGQPGQSRRVLHQLPHGEGRSLPAILTLHSYSPPNWSQLQYMQRNR